MFLSLLPLPSTLALILGYHGWILPIPSLPLLALCEGRGGGGGGGGVKGKQ